MKIKYLTISIAIASLSFILSACRSTSVNEENKSNQKDEELSGYISISGAFALYPLTVKWAEEFAKKYPEVQIDISAGGAGKGMADVLSGMVDLAMFSREVSPQEEERGAWKIQVARDAVFPTVNANNPAIDPILKKGLTVDQLNSLYTDEEQKVWDMFDGYSSGEIINVYTRSDACGAAATWAQLFDKEQEDLTGTGVFGDPGMADAVKKDNYGVGYNNLIYIYDIKTQEVVEGLEIIPLDLNNNRMIDPEENIYETINDAVIAIQKGLYPSPPARALYLISKGKPSDPAIISFLQFILSEGQNFIAEAGYVQLEGTMLEQGRTKLNISK